MSDAADGSRVGSQFGPYRLKRLLGSGGMGEVYEAEDTVKEGVSLKLLSPVLCQDPVFRDRLLAASTNQQVGHQRWFERR